jgi:hypothetical protein
MIRNHDIRIECVASLCIVGRGLDVIADVVNHKNTFEDRRLSILMNVDSRPTRMLPLIEPSTRAFDICFTQEDSMFRSINHLLPADCAICCQVLNRGAFCENIMVRFQLQLDVQIALDVEGQVELGQGC